MLHKIKITNFRSIQTMDLYFEKTNNIIGKNWAWKTNILQAISYLFENNVSNLKIDEILKIWEKYLCIEWIFINNHWLENKILFSYDCELNKKQILLNGKKVTKKILHENILKISYFSPISMNLFYLGPKYRREFIDSILKNTCPSYDKLLHDYEKILKNRNKVLKNIAEQKSTLDEITFWDNEFIKYSKKIYEERSQINNYLKENIKDNTNIFQNKIEHISFLYITKVDIKNIEKSIRDYLEKNLQRDIILWKTHIWPHVDDFDILIDNKSIVNYASRWEIKSIIINLKLLEIHYIKEITGNFPIVLIDDLSSELDYEHSQLILEKLTNLQIIFTSILALNKEKNNIIEI